MIAAAINDANTIPDHKLHVIRCTSEDGAQRVANVLASLLSITYQGLRDLNFSKRIVPTLHRSASAPTGSVLANATDAIAASLGLSLEQYAAVEAAALDSDSEG